MDNFLINRRNLTGFMIITVLVTFLPRAESISCNFFNTTAWVISVSFGNSCFALSCQGKKEKSSGTETHINHSQCREVTKPGWTTSPMCYPYPNKHIYYEVTASLATRSLAGWHTELNTWLVHIYTPDHLPKLTKMILSLQSNLHHHLYLLWTST